MASGKAKTAALGGFGLFCVVLGYSLHGAPEPVVEREVKFIEKPSIPKVITREVPGETVYEVLPPPAACFDLGDTAREFIVEANRFNNWSQSVYDRVEDVDLAQLDDSQAMTRLVLDLDRERDGQVSALRGLLQLGNEYKIVVEECEEGIANLESASSE